MKVEILSDWNYEWSATEAIRPGVTVDGARIGTSWDGVALSAIYKHPATGESYYSAPGDYRIIEEGN